RSESHPSLYHGAPGAFDRVMDVFVRSVIFRSRKRGQSKGVTELFGRAGVTKYAKYIDDFPVEIIDYFHRCSWFPHQNRGGAGEWFNVDPVRWEMADNPW